MLKLLMLTKTKVGPKSNTHTHTHTHTHTTEIKQDLKGPSEDRPPLHSLS